MRADFMNCLLIILRFSDNHDFKIAGWFNINIGK